MVKLENSSTVVLVPPKIQFNSRCTAQNSWACIQRWRMYTMNSAPKNMISVTRNVHMPTR